MSSEQPRTGRPPSSGSPAGSTVAIVVAVVAVVVAFFIIKNIRDDDGGSSATPTVPSSPVGTTPGSEVVVVTDPPSSVFVPVTTGSKVQVANAANQDGAAGGLSTQLAVLKFDMADPTNATVRLPTTKVLYDESVAGSQNVANSVAHYLGAGVTVEKAPSPVQTKDAVLPAGCGVLVMLGADKAGKTIDEMMGVTSSTDPVTATT